MLPYVETLHQALEAMNKLHFGISFMEQFSEDFIHSKEKQEIIESSTKRLREALDDLVEIFRM
jgi:hypothetical protein